MMETWLSFVIERSEELWTRTGEHLVLTVISTFIAVFIGIPLGVLASKIRAIRNPLTGFVSILQTIPSLAMLAILLAVMNQIGAIPAIAALSIYALLPIVRNTLTGLEQVPSSSLEAARGLGMTGRQSLILVEMPFAIPTIIAGVRTAAVVGVGIATLSAFIGAGGLGEFINRGLALSNTQLILLGAIPAAILALIVDGSIGAFQWAIQVRKARTASNRLLHWVVRPVALVLPLILSTAGVYASIASRNAAVMGSDNGVIRIASKNFTEQMILGEMMAQMIEHHTDLTVERHFNLGGTMICHEALVAGEVDLYAEYVGTALTAILGIERKVGRNDALRTVKDAYADRFGCTWIDPFGFENTYALAVTRDLAIANDLSSVSDLASIRGTLRAGFPSEFMERPDGYPGLRDIYGLSFGTVIDLDPSLMYQALALGELDVISAFSTDGRIEANGFVVLDDDLSFFPPYHAAPVLRAAILQDEPNVGAVIRRLSGRIDTRTMQRLNYGVDHGKRAPAEVAAEFLTNAGLLD
jgi:osmoprotectant transport system permease protein